MKCQRQEKIFKVKKKLPSLNRQKIIIYVWICVHIHVMCVLHTLLRYTNTMSCKYMSVCNSMHVLCVIDVDAYMLISLFGSYFSFY